MKQKLFYGPAIDETENLNNWVATLFHPQSKW